MATIPSLTPLAYQSCDGTMYYTNTHTPRSETSERINLVHGSQIITRFGVAQLGLSAAVETVEQHPVASHNLFLFFPSLSLSGFFLLYR